ncbi:hypothetical protein [Thiocapsa roseopersicina]|uniref:Uncharacterized protein n=1 Tax=Thiocapsa roseopersicina TaxID=1058 RepID=A0A1H2WVZ8_THIRO|nr:hypothetical protein [Thiocapsa roseopersicina]SDW84688.1 hypothetical protein SAMN05421783_109149 [Thiocapsa roseopersicina]
MGEHDKGQQGQAGGPMAPGQPSMERQQQGANPQGNAQGQSPSPPGAQQGVLPGGPQAGMAGPGMASPYPGFPGPGGYAGRPGFVAPGMHPGVAPHPAAYGLPPGVDPYWAYQAQAQAAYAPPPYPYPGPYVGPYAGMAPPQAPWPGYAPGLEQQGGAGRMAGGRHGAGMADLVDEIANGGNGLSSLGKMFNLEDSEFWKGALLGAAAVLLLTNESVQGALFKTGAKTKAAVKTGVDRVKERVRQSGDANTQETKDV